MLTRYQKQKIRNLCATDSKIAWKGVVLMFGYDEGDVRRFMDQEVKPRPKKRRLPDHAREMIAEGFDPAAVWAAFGECQETTR